MLQDSGNKKHGAGMVAGPEPSSGTTITGFDANHCSAHRVQSGISSGTTMQHINPVMAQTVGRSGAEPVLVPSSIDSKSRSQNSPCPCLAKGMDGCCVKSGEGGPLKSLHPKEAHFSIQKSRQFQTKVQTIYWLLSFLGRGFLVQEFVCLRYVFVLPTYQAFAAPLSLQLHPGCTRSRKSLKRC